jgi:hypothetical protein
MKGMTSDFYVLTLRFFGFLRIFLELMFYLSNELKGILLSDPAVSIGWSFMESLGSSLNLTFFFFLLLAYFKSSILMIGFFLRFLIYPSVFLWVPNFEWKFIVALEA